MEEGHERACAEVVPSTEAAAKRVTVHAAAVRVAAVIILNCFSFFSSTAKDDTRLFLLRD